MAPKKAEKIENPPMVVNSSEEEEVSGSSEEESGSLGEESDTCGDESDSPVEESKKEESLKNPQNRVVTKPRPESSLSKKTTKSSDMAALPAKRSLEKAEEESKKKMKKTSSTTEEKVKSSVSGDETPKLNKFQRLFTEKDEIVLLRGILEFTATNAKLFENIDAFHEFVKDSITYDATASQLKTKIRNLRRKFYKTVDNSLKKGITEEDQIVFSKVLDQRCFDLSRKIWGVNGVLPSKASKKSEVKKVGRKLKEEEEEAVITERNVGSTCLSSGSREIVSFLKAENVTCFGLDESTLLAGWDMVEDGPKKRELEERLKKIKAMQAELCLKRIQLVTNTSKVMFGDNASSSGK